MIRPHLYLELNLKKVVEVMGYVYLNDENVTTQHLREKFGEEQFILFQRYCAGGEMEYTKEYGGNKWKLNQNGIRHLYELERVLAEERRTDWIKWATIAIAMLAGVQAWAMLK